MQSNTNDTKRPTLPKKPHILWLSSWYPSKIDPLLGDFIQRQAQAASLQENIVVWAIIDDPDGKVTTTQKKEVFYSPNLEENLLYINTSAYKNNPGYKYWKVINILYFGWKAIKEYYRFHEKPAAIHTHIAMYMGLIGHKLSKKMGIPHIVSEQWTAFLPEAIPNITAFNFWSRLQLQKVLQGAAAITAVSDYLLGFLKKLTPPKIFLRIPNVVDGSLFKPGIKNDIPVFLCISADSYQKNLLDVLKAAQLLKQNPANPVFLLQIIHHPDSALIKQVQDLNIADRVELLRPGSHSMVATYMSAAHALILYSRYETFGCVVIEAQSCGLPVIASDIPVLRELVSQGINGMLVAPESPFHLAEAMLKIIQGEVPFDATNIRNTVLENYGFMQVSKQYLHLYRSLTSLK